MDRIFLIDGHSLIFRMYYAFLRRPMINSKGTDTSILFGFTKYLLELIGKESPTHMAVMFDAPAKTFRHEIYPEYKATRLAAPELVREALDPCTEIVNALGIKVYTIPGVEADDVMGTIAKIASGKGFDAYIVTPDKDLAQIVGDHIFQYKPGKSGSESEILGTEEVCKKYGINTPSQVIDILTLWGDTADNVKGVDGVGELTAAKLVSKYDSVEGIYRHLGELSKKQQTAFRNAEDHIGLSKFLVTVKTDVDVEFNPEEMRLHPVYSEEVAKIFNYYEFPSLVKMLPQEGAENIGTGASGYAVKAIRRTAGEITDEAAKCKRVALNVKKELILSIGSEYAVCTPSEAGGILEDASVEKVGYGLKEQINSLKNEGIALKGRLWDIELLHYILNPERTHKLDILAKCYLHADICKEAGKEDEAIQGDLFSAPEEAVEDRESAYRESAVLTLLCDAILKEVREQKLEELYLKIEEPLIRVLADMERTGVKINVGQLEKYGLELDSERIELEKKAREMAGNPDLNLSSPKQIGPMLYEKLKLNPRIRPNSKGSYPTDEETLDGLREKHPIIDTILEYRAVKKLQSTYVEPLPKLIDPADGKIHTSFNQALTATGRLSSSHPNLQNIPVRTERGKEIRKAFVPSNPDGLIISADYSQIELRIMAHLSGDPHMRQAFLEGKDVHTATASKLFGVREEEVTKEQRRRAKTANFGIIYGISAFGLSRRLGIPRSESKEFIESYFAKYPKVKEFIHTQIESAKENGYAETIFGRKRYLPDINSRNQTVRGLAERNAVNAPIQGSAADIIKLAMSEVFRRMNEEGLKSKMVLQVHDELVIDAIKEEKDVMTKILKEEMENVCKLSVPLTIECSYGSNWLEAH
ncbi:MAG: DNA polymerase I [Bacteroidales bacterium]|jgi:DNA polymerase-1|nr:DNA polymerase I [Bacteroidales bacterium]